MVENGWKRLKAAENGWKWLKTVESGWVSEFPSFQVSKGGREGGPMRGLELIMWSQGQWEALEKTASDDANRQTDIATLWLKRPSGANSVKIQNGFKRITEGGYLLLEMEKRVCIIHHNFCCCDQCSRFLAYKRDVSKIQIVVKDTYLTDYINKK